MALDEAVATEHVAGWRRAAGLAGLVSAVRLFAETPSLLVDAVGNFRQSSVAADRCRAGQDLATVFVAC